MLCCIICIVVKQFYVYELTDLTGIPFYVGKGMQFGKYNRLNFHKNHWQHNKNRKLRNKINKLAGLFNTKILLTSPDEKECLELEVKLIKQIGLQNLCNLTDGGEGICGYKHTPKTKKLMSELSLSPARIKVAIANVQKAIAENCGKRKFLSIHNAIVELYKTKTLNEMCFILNTDYTTLHGYLVECGLYIKNKNVTYDNERLRKLGEINGKRFAKPVCQFDKNGFFIREYESIVAASNATGGPSSRPDITSCCKGKRKTARGFIWRYKR